jgi:hypothetical protein
MGSPLGVRLGAAAGNRVWVALAVGVNVDDIVKDGIGV